MTRTLILSAALLLAGCLQPVPVKPDAPATADAAAFGESLARWIETEAETTDQVYKVAARSAKRLGVDPKALDVLGSIGEDRKLDDATRKDIAAKARRIR